MVMGMTTIPVVPEWLTAFAAQVAGLAARPGMIERIRVAIDEWAELRQGRRGAFATMPGENAYTSAVTNLELTVQGRLPGLDPLVVLAAVHDYVATEARIGPDDEACPEYATFVHALAIERANYGPTFLLTNLEVLLAKVSQQYYAGDPSSSASMVKGSKIADRQEEDADPPTLITARDAAKVLGICDKSLWNATHRGEIPAVKLGRSVRYDPRDLNRWIESNKATGVKS
jgi:excisionase family DNA binding protein